VSPVKYELGFYIQGDAILHSHRRENLTSYIGYFLIKYLIILVFIRILGSDDLSFLPLLYVSVAVLKRELGYSPFHTNLFV
jgi:hypothetical protein